MCWRLMLVGWAVCAAAGCGPAGGAADLTRLESADPTERVKAIIQLTDQVGADQDASRTLQAALVDRLEDEDKAVRMFAIAGLDRLTGQRFGYAAFHGPQRRLQAVQRWRSYLAGGALARGEKTP